MLELSLLAVTGLLQILIVLIVVGAVLYLIGLIPMDATIKQILYVATVVLVAIWLLQLLLGGGHVGL